ncbi:helix-turn-helix domain-containing protein [Peribacillus sp. SI8-4]|uniref:helix-turn-helix domain-containing protein n=1 Tax=Peribacillus sp. SI8-4 TaxID=3048009 RepID=UPI0025522D05|nr:helix-turn-helix domain-containing protein [Peribacillus sp. SI8-4]
MNNYLQAIILYAIKKFQGERSIYAIYHMLQGKKSSQTIQDAHLFGLTNIFGTMPVFTRQQLNQNIEQFLRDGFIDLTDKTDAYEVSQAGEEALARYLLDKPFPTYLNGWKYQNIAPVFWGRVSLLIQTISHIVHNERRFYPIQRSPKLQYFVKEFLHTNRQDRSLIARQIYEELVSLLESQSDLKRDIFILKLTGVNRIGLTFDQIAKRKEAEEEYVRFLFFDSLHQLLAELGDGADHPLLASLTNEWKRGGNPHLTQSTQTTLQYLQEGRSMSEIAEIRRLKQNTIEDHLVEIVLSDKRFPIADYVSSDDEREIAAAITELGTKKLKAIKQMVDNKQISFFQIRLVLAKMGDQ